MLNFQSKVGSISVISTGLDEGLKPENVLQEQRCQPKKVGIRKVLGFASSQPAKT